MKWSPFGMSQGCCGLCLSRFSGLLNVVVSILYRSPFHLSDSFAYKVLPVTWSPFRMSLVSFGALSSSGFWFFPEAVPFSTRSGSIQPSSGSSLVSFRGCRHRSLRCLCLCGCFVSALRLLSSVRGSLFLSWTFVLCATPSTVSECLRVLLLRSVTCLDLRFSFSDGVACWDKSLMFLFAPSSSTLVVLSDFCRMFPGFHPCFCIRGFLSSFLFLPGFVPPSLLVGVVHSIFSAFFFSFGLPGLFVAFTSPVQFTP